MSSACLQSRKQGIKNHRWEVLGGFFQCLDQTLHLRAGCLERPMCPYTGGISLAYILMEGFCCFQLAVRKARKQSTTVSAKRIRHDFISMRIA